MYHAFLYLMNSNKEWQAGALQALFWNNLAVTLTDSGLSVHLSSISFVPTLQSTFHLEALFRLSYSTKTGNPSKSVVISLSCRDRDKFRKVEMAKIGEAWYGSSKGTKKGP